ncbi:MAG TPA: alpha-ribazole transporter, partial [Firmicutes bacterium]|nr:alpha-ribazole transporter [Bacillota bacterium]
KRVSIIAIFLALSAVGAMIKIPSPIGTIGLDSAPGYFCALAFGGVEGAIVIGIGHILSAAVCGFPLSIPIHVVIALAMMLWSLVYRWVAFKIKYGIIPAIVLVSLLNGVVTCFLLVFVGGWGMVFGTMPFLLLASAVNIIISAIAFKFVQGSKLI